MERKKSKERREEQKGEQEQTGGGGKRGGKEKQMYLFLSLNVLAPFQLPLSGWEHPATRTSSQSPLVFVTAIHPKHVGSPVPRQVVGWGRGAVGAEAEEGCKGFWRH